MAALEADLDALLGPLEALAVPSFTQGFATFPLVLPPGSATGSVNVVGGMGQQTDVRKQWPDGSIKLCMVSTYIPSAGSYPVTRGPQSIAPVFVPKWPSVTVELTLAGTDYVAVLPPFQGADSSIVGPMVREAREVVTPTAVGVPHRALQVIFDVRSYNGGGHRIDIQLQSTRNTKAAGGPVAADVRIVVGGQTVYSESNVTIFYATRPFRFVYKAGLKESFVTPDLAPFYAVGAIPRFLPTVQNPTPSSVGPQFKIGQFGDMRQDMSDAGGRPEIGCLPWWIAEYLVHQTPDLWYYMIAQAQMSGSWYGHFANGDGVSLPTIDQNPDWYFGFNSNITQPVGPLASVVNTAGLFAPGGPPGTVPQSHLETAHLPSLCYVPWLLTGDRYFADQMKYWANYVLLNANWGRSGSAGLIIDAEQPRGVAKGLQALAEAGAWLPDADPMLPYFAQKAQNNITALDALAATAQGGITNAMFLRPDALGKTYPMWQEAYIAWTVQHARDMGFNSSGAFQRRVITTQIQLMSSAAAGFPITGSAPGWIFVSDANGQLYTSLADIYERTKLYCLTVQQQPSGVLPWPGFFGAEARLLLLMGVNMGIPGAQAAYDYLHPIMLPDLNYRAGYAIAP